MKKIVLLILAVVAGAIHLAGFEVVKDGKLQLDGIVMAGKATSSEKRAAEELVYYFEKSTGAKLPVITGQAKPNGKYIYLGAKDDFGYNHGRIIITAGNIYLAGNDGTRDYLASNNSTGTLFAAYEFLEKYLGVRWLWPGELGEVAPVHKNLDLADVRLEVKPKTASSLWRAAHGMRSGWRNPDNRLKFAHEQDIWLKRHRFSCNYTDFQLGHAFIDYFDRYGKEHPEYFSLLPDGTRRSNPYNWGKGDPKFISLCVTEPGLIRTIVDNWKNANPRPKTLNLNENDTGGECVCPNCLAADHSPVPAETRFAKAKERFDKKDNYWPDELGSVSDRYCRFYLEAQKEADKIDPNHRIMGLIYANYSKPPTDKIKLNERITLRFCPPFMYPWTDKKIQEYKEIYSGWANTGAMLMFRPNFTLDGSYFPVQYQDVFYELYTFSTPNMVAVDMDSLTGNYSVQGLVNYVIANLNHDRETSLNELKDTFCSAFGAAKPQVKEYIDYLTEVSMNAKFKLDSEGRPEGGALYLNLFLVADTVFTPEVMAKCWALLNAAGNAPGLDPVAAKRVEFLKSGLKNVEMTMAAQAEFRKFKAKAPIDAFAKAVQELDDFRASIEETGALNMGNIRMLEDRHWPSRSRLYLVGADRTELTGWKILFDPENKGLKEKWFQPEFDISLARDIKTNAQGKKEITELRKQAAEKSPDTVWYYNRLDKVKPADGKKLKLMFQAIYGNARVYLNGKQIFARSVTGDRYFWKDPILFDIPEGLMKPEGNLLVVRTDYGTDISGIWAPVNVIYNQ